MTKSDFNKIHESIDDAINMLLESNWIDSVHAKYKPPEGLFKKSPAAITGELKAAHKSGRSAMRSLLFFINRAGSKLSSEDRARMEKAKIALSRLISLTKSR
jgi:hypothetical protein